MAYAWNQKDAQFGYLILKAVMLAQPSSFSEFKSMSAVLYPPWVIPYGFHTDSIQFPDGFHTIFRVQSIWIPYGMSSWNHNSTLISHHFQGGVHME